MNQISDIIADNHSDLAPYVPSEEPTTEGTTPEAPTVDTAALRQSIQSMKTQLDAMLRMLDGDPTAAAAPTVVHTSDDAIAGEQVIEGVFNGEKMIGPDGKEYGVPTNYASKSKLVEGDLMKLTITTNGSFLYKQIGPTERKRVVGELLRDSETHQWSVLVDGHPYRILTASVTFYKGQSGDEVVILVPADGKSTWGAVENIIKKT